MINFLMALKSIKNLILSYKEEHERVIHLNTQRAIVMIQFNLQGDFMMRKKLQLLLLLSGFTLNADQFSLSVYNDLFIGKDEHFTSGVGFTWLEDNEKNSYTHFLLDGLNTLNIDMDSSKKYNAGVSLTQIIITPTDTTLSTPQYNDMPYAGYLALSTYLIQSDGDSFVEYAFDLGVVGPASLAEKSQKIVHDIIGDVKPQGWDTQLDSQVTANFLAQYGQITWEGKVTHDLNADWFNHMGISLGNFNTSALGGTAFRLGKNYVRNFNLHYPYLKEEATLVDIAPQHKGFGWSVSSGMDVELLAYSYILDEAQNEGYQTDKETIKFAAYISGDIYYNNHKLSLFYQGQTPFTKQQNSNAYFGGILYAYKF